MGEAVAKPSRVRDWLVGPLGEESEEVSSVAGGEGSIHVKSEAAVGNIVREVGYREAGGRN